MNPSVSIIVPVYNARKTIARCIESIINQEFQDFELLLVNDGSKDKTKQEIERAIRDDAKQPHPVVPGMRVSGTRIKLVTSNKNRGKGNAIISGISQADYIAFVDADLELNPAQLEGYLKKMQESGSDVVIGCKFHKDSELHYPFVRKVISLGYYMMLLVLFHLNVRDTQTGLKVFRQRL